MTTPFVLCIDDRRPLLDLRRATLESRGYQVLIASCQNDALKLLAERPVGVILLEYRLEGLDAEAVALHVKQRFPAVPVILLSAYSEMPERILWLVDEFMMKSAPADQLVNAIERIIHSAGQASCLAAA